MRNRNILIAVIILAVIIVGLIAVLMLFINQPVTQQNITEKGTKLDLKNNNNQLWQHMDIVIENVTAKNGSKMNYYIEVWVKPGQNQTIDLSNLMGYGNERLPTGTVIKTLDWGSVLNNTVNGNNTNTTFTMTLRGWSNTFNPPSNDPVYNVNFLNMPLGPLPSQVTNNLWYFNYTKPTVDAYTAANYPHTDQYEVMFTEIDMTVDTNGNLVMVFALPPTLCSTIAHIISQ